MVRPLLGRPELVRKFHALGLRSAQPTWKHRNEVADGVGVTAAGELTERRREIVAELDRPGACSTSRTSGRPPQGRDAARIHGGPLGRGYGEDNVAKILGGNALRVVRSVLPAARARERG